MPGYRPADLDKTGFNGRMRPELQVTVPRQPNEAEPAVLPDGRVPDRALAPCVFPRETRPPRPPVFVRDVAGGLVAIDVGDRGVASQGLSVRDGDEELT